MSAPRDQETILAAWLEDGPNELPDATRRAIATGIRTTPQARNRFGWFGRSNELSRFESVGALTTLAVAVVVAFAALSGINRPNVDLGGPSSPSPLPSAAQTSSPSPSPVSAPTPPWQTFTSQRFGYTIGLPGAWTHVTITDDADWMPDDLYPGLESTYADRWQAPGSTSPWFLVAVRNPAPQEPLAAWAGRYGSGLAAQCDARDETTVPVDNESGVLRIASCVPGGLLMMDVLVLHAGRAYAIQLNYPAADYAVDQALMTDLLASFRFTR
jgi:hypothetical protein